jgi:RNA polymerase sigma-70 factor (ECF subfamily)
MSTGPHNRTKADRERLEDRLASLYEEYYDRIATYAYVHIGDRAEAQDIAGEAFLRALKSLGSYRERGTPMQAWLFRIAHNLIVDHLRKAARRKQVPIGSVEVASEADPAHEVERHLEMERVAEAMAQLTEQQREVVRLRFFGGLNSREAGVVMGKSPGAVREMQRAAIDRLRALLRPPALCESVHDNER